MLITRRLTKEKPIIFDSKEERIININTISLESADEKYSIDIYCQNKQKKEEFKICSLKKGSQEIYSTELVLDLHHLNDKYEFYLKTKCNKVAVNIIGYYEKEEDEEEEQEEKIQEKKIEKEKKENKKEKNESESDSDSNDEIDFEDNKPNVSLVELLNKKRKEAPQEIKPVILKNLAKKKNDEGKEIKKEKKDIKEKIKDKNLGKFDKKDKKTINKQ